MRRLLITAAVLLGLGLAYAAGTAPRGLDLRRETTVAVPAAWGEVIAVSAREAGLQRGALIAFRAEDGTLRLVSLYPGQESLDWKVVRTP